jgi:hypothetical protein
VKQEIRVRFGRDDKFVVNRSSGFSSTWVGGKAHDLSGRDDKSVEGAPIKGSSKEFVISTGALSWACGPPKLMKNCCSDSTRICHLDRSEAQWRDLRFGCAHNFVIPTGA